MVPDVRGKDLTEALLELQVKELYPRIQLRYSQSAYDKGLILEQNPNGGTIVKAGRRVRLVVSQGVVINTVENYTGRNIDEVRMDLRTLFASAGNVSSQPLLSLKEPIMYQFSNEPAGTILRQSPEPGTQISGPMVLEFVVSRGLENAITKVPALVGLSVSAALEEINKAGMSFIFSLRPARNNEKAEMVVYQDPPAQSPVAVNTAVSVMVSAPLQVDEGEVFGLFNYTLQENPYPLPVSLEALLPSGERRLLAAVDHPGGAFTFPYRLPRGTTLILSMLNREIYREEIYPSPDELSLDQL
ncbi:MAG: PASTA domain-containing protein, partial [Spirochaetaceae bacterium]|jgi:beta-lactam-binding protein with PASTA domain|nr:PASTA domain-containing protein [Spirochaetaceae bacterium]